MKPPNERRMRRRGERVGRKLAEDIFADLASRSELGPADEERAIEHAKARLHELTQAVAREGVPSLMVGKFTTAALCGLLDRMHEIRDRRAAESIDAPIVTRH